jgi:hypothetical protein
MFGTRVLGEFNPHFSPNFSVFFSNHNTLPLPSGLWMRFYGDWVKVGVSPNILKDYPTNLHKNSSTKQSMKVLRRGNGRRQEHLSITTGAHVLLLPHMLVSDDHTFRFLPLPLCAGDAFYTRIGEEQCGAISWLKIGLSATDPPTRCHQPYFGTPAISWVSSTTVAFDHRKQPVK